MGTGGREKEREGDAEEDTPTLSRVSAARGRWDANNTAQSIRTSGNSLPLRCMSCQTEPPRGHAPVPTDEYCTTRWETSGANEERKKKEIKSVAADKGPL